MRRGATHSRDEIVRFIELKKDKFYFPHSFGKLGIQ